MDVTTIPTATVEATDSTARVPLAMLAGWGAGMGSAAYVTARCPIIPASS